VPAAHALLLQHFIALAPDEAQCDSLARHAKYASCVWTSYPGESESPGWLHQGRLNVMALWIQRYHACTTLAIAGVNVLMMDLDTIIFRDPYPELKAPPLKDVKLIHLKEGFANGGLFYMQNVHSGSPAFWVHKHVMATANLIVHTQHTSGQSLGTMMDQALLNDNLNDAGCNSSVLDMPSVFVTGENAHNNPFWTTRSPVFGKTAAELSVRGNQGQRWYCDFSYSGRHSYAHAAELHPCEHVGGDGASNGAEIAELLRDTGACQAAWERYSREKLSDLPLQYLELRIPLDATDPAPGPEGSRAMELFAVAPEWVFGHCDSAHSGWHSSALIHLVACSADWGGGGDGGEWTHVGRRALMVAAGAWRREGNLGESQPYMTVSPSVVAAANIQSKQDASRLIARVIAAAAQLGRMAALPAFDCSSPWMAKRDWARWGVFDHSIVKYRGQCYPAPGGRECGYHHVIGGYEFFQLHGASNHVMVESLDFVTDQEQAKPEVAARVNHVRGRATDTSRDGARFDCLKTCVVCEIR